LENLNAVLSEYKSIIDKKIFSTLQNTHPKDLYEPMRYAVQAGGKRLRPVTALIICDAVGGSHDQMLPVAAALEIVHNFTLVHDDIMDRDELRRGRETVYKKWNENVAILSGDALLVKAYALLADVSPEKYARVMQLFSHGILEVCEGQILDMSFEERQSVSLDEYFEMIDKKTAALFALSCQLGAVCGDASEKQIDAMYQFGMALGRAFQIQDDLLDLMAGENELGKDVGSDLESGKQTFLVLHALQNGSEKQVTQFINLMHKKLNHEEIQQAQYVLQDIGTIDAAQEQVQSAIATAKKSLTTLPESHYKNILEKFILTIENRTF